MILYRRQSYQAKWILFAGKGSGRRRLWENTNLLYDQLSLSGLIRMYGRTFWKSKAKEFVFQEMRKLLL